MLPKQAWIFENCQGKAAWPVTFEKTLETVKYVRADTVEKLDTTSYDDKIKKLQAENRKLRKKVKDLESKEYEVNVEYENSETTDN